ncbi:MAG: nucleotide sugar dehydrogenase [Bacteroidetes bacterium]|nr:nucleotide sugar dehydrogenase [Bacteroidota bacterium]MCH8033938.1 nucleotide sugar dehydrogenase [Bacteroidota bacterium]
MELLEKINNKKVKIGIIGLGYVGLPLGLEFAGKGFDVLGFDLDERKIEFLKEGKSYIKHISSEKIKKTVSDGKLRATLDFSKISEMDAIIICVPTPLNEHREPDMSYVEGTAKTIAKYLKKGQLIILESTTYPGTTEDILLPLFEKAEPAGNNGFKVGKDFYLAFSPEREDPNNPKYSTSTIPKVIGGVTQECLKVTKALYDQVIVETVTVSSPRVAEATKLLENIYRSVNIALVNELKMVFDRMDIDIWEVVRAASTKPFGYTPFYPGPGLGGHCIPIDPFYLTWKAREFEINTKFIELAGEINTYQPYYVVERSMEILNKFKKPLNGSKVLILGASYKKDIDDMRESPSLKLIEIFRERCAEVYYSDSYVPKLPKTRRYNYEMESVELTAETVSKYDLIVLSTDHSNFDYKMIAENAKLIIDTRNAFEKNKISSNKIYKA